MNHDISHCNASTCPRASTCHRYKAHLEAERLNLKYLTYLIHQSQEDIEKCTAYWEYVPW